MGQYTRADALLLRLGAAREILAHHIDVWREALAADRARPQTVALTRAELAFLPAALEVSESPASPAARLIAATIMACFGVGIAWASIGELDIVAAAPGKVMPSERVKTLQPLETAVVRDIAVKDGDKVRAGQELITLEATGARSDAGRLAYEHASAVAEAARWQALLRPDPPAAWVPPQDVPDDVLATQRALLLSQWVEYQARLTRYDRDMAANRAEQATAAAEQARLVAMETTTRDRVERRRGLADKGLLPATEFSKDEQSLAEVSGQRRVAESRQSEARANLDKALAAKVQTAEEFRRDATAKLAETGSRARSLAEELAKANERQAVQTLKAPVAGTVQQLAVHTVGGVVTPAQALLVVVPAGSALEVEARLPNKDIGFVEEGQEAMVKVDAFPFTRYGTLAGRVETVSGDAVQDEHSKEFYFPLRVSLAEAAITVENGKRVALSPGMTVVVEVKTGSRKPIEYVLAPLQKYRDESGRER